MSVIGKISGMGFLAGLIAGSTSATATVLFLLPAAPVVPGVMNTVQQVPTLCWLIAMACMIAGLLRFAKNSRKDRDSAKHATAIAHSDALTSLGNRRALTLRAAEVQALSGPRTCAILMIDLDHFKRVNDTLGHAAGDLVLQKVSARIAAVCPATARVYRLGGDEFAVFVEELPDLATLSHLVKAVHAAVERPVIGQGWRVVMECSIGRAVGPANLGIERLLTVADRTMYEQKDDHHTRTQQSFVQMLVAPAPLPEADRNALRARSA